MKILLALAMLSLLMVSCNDKDIDGMLKVFSDFTLMDEDGFRLSISAGTYEAEFSYDKQDDAIELEIDDVVAGYDRDFLFSLPNLDDAIVEYDGETKTEQVRYHLPASETGQTVDAEVVVSNRIISQKPPQVYWDRCNAHIGIWGGLHGLLDESRNRHNPHSRSGGSISQHIYSVASFTESQVSVAISLVVGEETVALFEGTERRQYRNLLWVGECGDYDRPVIRRD